MSSWKNSPFKLKFYKWTANKRIHLEEISDFISQQLSKEQLEKLSIKTEQGIYSIKEQILLSYVDNRYKLVSNSDKREVVIEIEKCIEKYKFLLESSLDPERARYIFVKAILNVISTGSGVFLLDWDSNNLVFWILKINCVPRTWSLFLKKEFLNICKLIKNKYSTIPKANQFAHNKWSNLRRSDGCRDRTLLRRYSFVLGLQLLVTYAYPFHKLIKKRKNCKQKLEEELLKRIKWYLESLTKCSTIFFNKYRGGVCKELSCGMGMDTDISYFPVCIFLKDIEEGQYKDKDDLSELIVSFFSEKELELLELKDSENKTWSFREQIQDRYYSKYPSFASPEEIRSHIKKKIEEYRPLLNLETVEVIKDTLFDEIENEAFVSLQTHLWNQEMAKNLRERKINKPNRRVRAAINLLISFFPPSSVEQLATEEGDLIFSLKEQLLARWRNAWFASSLRAFREYLSLLHIYSPYNTHNWKNQESVSRIDLQAFLSEIDMFFLYPQKWRLVKKLLFRLDTGRAVGVSNIKRVLLYDGDEPRIKIKAIYLLLISTLLIILCNL